MLTNAKHLKGFVIRATDGELGVVDELYFDDDSWTIRYFIVGTGGWLGGRPVLISPISIIHTDWTGQRLDVALTKDQVQQSPDIYTRQPISRQHEAEYTSYYGYDSYWAESNAWIGMPSPLRDCHLRSVETVTGYHIEATDGEIGHVCGFVVDDETWAIRFLEVATRNWWPGKKVLISPAWIKSVSWEESKVYVDLTREAIQNGPPYVESNPIDREYESKLYGHYSRPPYWMPTEGEYPRSAQQPLRT